MLRIRLVLLVLVQFWISGCTEYSSFGGKQSFQLPGPKLIVADLPSAIRGNSPYTLRFNSSATLPLHIRSLVLSYSADKSEFKKIADLPGETGTYDWQVPSIDSPDVRIHIEVTDTVGNQATVDKTFAIRSTPPSFTQTLLPNYYVSTTNSVTYGKDCAPEYEVSAVEVVGSTSTQISKTPCSNHSWRVTIPSTSDGKRQFVFTQSDPVGLVTSIPVTWIRDTVAPTSSEFTLTDLNGNSGTTTTNFIKVNLRSADSATHITDFCIQSFPGTPPPSLTAPLPSDASCTSVNNRNIDPPLVLSQTLNLKGYSYRLGFTPGSYSLVAWVHDEAGNASAPITANILYTPYPPPVVTNVFATNTDAITLPLPATATTLAAGAAVFIRWKAEAAGGLDAKPISLYYTLDDKNYAPIALELANIPNGGCTIDPSLESGCYVWPNGAPSDGFFKVRVAVKDRNGMVSFGPSNFLNSGKISSIAGNTDTGLGASATAATFFNYSEQKYYSDPDSFVVTADGTIYFRDSQRGILSLSPIDGVLKILIPTTGTASGDNGPAKNATLKGPRKITLAFDGRLLITDYDRIRVYDPKTGTIKLFLGGGTSTDDGVGPLAVSMTRQDFGNGFYVPLIPLPNGNLVFQSDSYYYDASSNPRGRIRIYDAKTNTVSSLYAQGIGDNTDTNENIVTCSTVVAGVTFNCNLANFGVGYNPVSGAIDLLQTSIIHRVVAGTRTSFANLNTAPGANYGFTKLPHPPAIGFDELVFRHSGRDGEIYTLSRNSSFIKRFDKNPASPTYNSWIPIAGTGLLGTCDDGTLAIQCPMDPTALYVDGQSQVYFMDRGRLRTIDRQGKVITLFGQSFFFGDGGLATSARFNRINAIRKSPSGTIFALDQQEYRLRELTLGGTIDSVAGNGSNTPANPALPAKGQGLMLVARGIYEDSFSIDPSTGKIVMPFKQGYFSVLDTTSGKWETPVSVNSVYLPVILGVGNGNALISTMDFDSTNNYTSNSLLRLFSLSGGLPTPLAGVAGKNPSSFCADGTSLNSCGVPNINLLSMATYEAVSKRWLALQTNANAIKALDPQTGSSMETLAPLTKGARSFAYRRKTVAGAEIEEIFYCATDGRIYRKQVGSANETALTWSIPSITCGGTSLIWNDAQDTLYFPYVENGLYGIGEYTL